MSKQSAQQFIESPVHRPGEVPFWTNDPSSSSRRANEWLPLGGMAVCARDMIPVNSSVTSGRGNPVKGKVNLVKEGGVWKLDEEFWAT
jgi:hypothetical protein